MDIAGARRERRSSARLTIAAVGLAALLLFVFFVSFLLGRYPVSPINVFSILASRVFNVTATWPPVMETVVLQIRLPRILLALLVGAALSTSGAAFQGMFRNPLVSPDILGVSAAAGFGAAVAILLDGSIAAIEITAMAFGLSGVGLALVLSRVHKTTPVVMLVLSGVIVGAFFAALISVTLYVADPEKKLPAITYWLLGSIGGANWRQLTYAAPLIVASCAGLLLVSWRINILAMGDEEARALGINVGLLQGIIVLCATVATATAVTVSGMVGWVGLVIPHAARMLVGPNHRALLPATMALGAAYLLAIDDVARAATGAEIPLGILTALIGTPAFAVLLRRAKGGWK